MEKHDGYKVKTCNIIFKSCYMIVFNCLEYKNRPATTAEMLKFLAEAVWYQLSSTWNRLKQTPSSHCMFWSPFQLFFSGQKGRRYQVATLHGVVEFCMKCGSLISSGSTY